jgi:hypothetical protein
LGAIGGVVVMVGRGERVQETSYQIA